MIKENKFIKSEGKIYEVVGYDGEGRPVCSLTTLKEIPEDKPLSVTEEEAPKRRTRKK